VPLAVQALAPFLLLSAGALAVSLPPFRRHGGRIAALATAGAAAVAVALLLQLAPAERVDIPYLRAFPAMDLAIRLDALSVAFGLVLLASACLLILARLFDSDDRRRPWSAWLLTTAAALGVVLAGNLVLIYALLRLGTLAWSGALDEAAPRGRGLRMAEQVADLGLLLAAGMAAAGAGTTALSGLPSDALGGAAFLLALLPVAVRIAALAAAAEGPRTPVLFHPAIVQAALSGYLLLRLVALAGGSPPGRGIQALLFGAGLGLAVVASVQAWRARSPGVARLRLVAAQAGIAIALCALGTPVAAVAGVWAWLGVVVVAALAGVRQPAGSPGALLTTVAMAVLPPGFAFTGLWLGSVSLVQSRLAIAVLPLWAGAVLAAAAALRHARPPRDGMSLPPSARLTAAAAALLMGAGALPWAVLPWLVLPPARIVRAIPGGTIGWGPLGVEAGPLGLPSLAVALAAGGALALWLRLAPRPLGASLWPLTWRRPIAAVPHLQPLDLGPWRTFPWLRLAWLAYTALVVVVIVRQ
jgi:hypothetical protein